METLLWVVLLTAIAGVGGTGLGGILGAVLNRDNFMLSGALLAFAGGVMMAVVCFDLIPQALRPEGAAEDMSIWVVVASVVVGFLFVFVINAVIDRMTSARKDPTEDGGAVALVAEKLGAGDARQDVRQGAGADAGARSGSGAGAGSERRELFVAGVVMAAAIALHNIPEGVVIGAAAAMDVTTVSHGTSGLLMAAIIGLHNIPEGMAVAVPLVSGGTRRGKAVLITASTGIPTIIGALIGVWLGLLSPLWLSISLSFAGGAMLYVVLAELLPEAFHFWRSKGTSVAAFVGAVLGLILVTI